MNVLVNENSLQDMADAIREVTSTNEKIKPSEMGNAQRNFANNLITTANATTGKEDTTLTNAVNSLVEGFGQGGSGIVSGSFTPTEPLLEIEIDVGFDFSHIIITLDDFSYGTGNGHKTFNHLYLDTEKRETAFITTNNAGASTAGYYVSMDIISPNHSLSKKDNLFIYKCSNPAGIIPGYLEPCKYNWYAW